MRSYSNKNRIILLFILIIAGALLFSPQALPVENKDVQRIISEQEQRVAQWRRERDQFFKTHERSPLLPSEKKTFNGLRYYPFNPDYIFCGKIERYIFNINNPRYYATFPTNKGTHKRYIRYGRFLFTLGGKEYTIEIYKSILGDTLFIPFKDRTNGKETYEGGRYIDAEILPGYQMILDFNMAYNPSCVYNDKFVCVLPPQENSLNIPIPAGEKNPNHPKKR